MKDGWLYSETLKMSIKPIVIKFPDPVTEKKVVDTKPK